MIRRIMKIGIYTVFSGILGALSINAAFANGGNNQAVQQQIKIRAEKFFAGQKPAPYGTYQYTDRGLLLAIQKHPSDFTLVDIRTPSFHDFFCGAHSNKHVCTGRGWQRVYGYREGHVPGAIDIPYLALTRALEHNTIPKDKTVVFMCPSGQLSNQVAGVFRMLGYQAYALRGGVNGWKKAGYPLVIGKHPGTMKQACYPWHHCWLQFKYDYPQAH